MSLRRPRQPRLTPGLVETVLEVSRVDFKPRHRQPTSTALVVATAFALLGSLVVDAVIVAIGTTVFSGTKGYVHFRFSDYSRLTVIGVLIACGAWPFICRITSQPRWLLFRAALLVSAALLIPDLYLVIVGQRPSAVFVLVVMHFSIAVVAYNSLVHLAPARPLRRRDS